MIHGPCSATNPNSVCMIDGQCQKKFPKQYQNEAEINFSGYPHYRRRDDGDTVRIGTYEVDNKFVVPYNSYLLRKYRAHINVEVCTSVKSVKYIFKYIYKGHDCAMMEVNNHNAANNEQVNGNEYNNHNAVNNEQDYEYNEIKQYLSCRYVSPPEAFWRLSEFKMHGQSHAVYRLALHLPDEQQVYYRPGEQQQAAARVEGRDTHLTAWFKLNQTDEHARNYLYVNIPEHYVFRKQTTTWTRRERFQNIVTRMHSASPRSGEKFYLRILLLHIPGATSFRDLRTVEGEIFGTFKEACVRLHLLDDDNELQATLTEAPEYQMPR